MAFFIRFAPGQCEQYLRDGWSRPEAEWVWCEGHASALQIPKPATASAYSLRLGVSPLLREPGAFRILSVSINGTMLLSQIVRSDTTVELFIPWDLIENGPPGAVDIELGHPNPARPSDILGAKDTRQLSIALTSLYLIRLPYGARPFAILDEADNVLGQAAAGSAAEADRRLRAEQARDAFIGRDGKPPDINVLLDQFLCGISAATHDLRKAARSLIDTRCKETGLIAPTASLFDAPFLLQKETVAKLFPYAEPILFSPASDDECPAAEVYPASLRAPHGVIFPSAISCAGARTERPALLLHSASTRDVFVSPYSYQVYNQRRGICWPSASPQGLSKVIEAAEVRALRGHLLIAQDWFDGGNFAHFLFDWITRVGHFVTAYPNKADHTTFLLGGQPTEFHVEIVRAMCRAFSLVPKQFLFPRKEINLQVEGDVYWFSDQMLNGMHPAQVMHPRSLDIFRQIAKALEVPNGSAERIYISRRDVAMRRVSNEGEIVALLARKGFIAVEFKGMPVREQWSTMFGAKVIVAPHGMGLTHLALHPGNPLLVELFNPRIGSDAYATLAAAKGLKYLALFGTEVDTKSRDFFIDPETLLNSLHDLLTPT